MLDVYRLYYIGRIRDIDRLRYIDRLSLSLSFYLFPSLPSHIYLFLVMP